MSESTGIDGETEVWLGGATSVSGDQFAEAMELVSDFQESVRDLQDEFADMELGLDREDAQRLVYGRNSQMSLSQVEGAFEVMDAVVNEKPDEIAPRILADQCSELTIGEAVQVWDDLVYLAEKYGDLNDQEEDDV